MINSTQVSFFTLAAYFDTGSFKYLFFLIALTLYVLIIVTNLFLVVLICINRSLHEPMYVFLCSLFINELYGSTALFPLLLQQILLDLHTVSAPFCFLQIFCIYTYGAIEFLILAIMSYDRYLAICCPLQYHSRMTQGRIAALIAVAWLFPFFVIFVAISLTMSLRLCGNVINRLYCGNQGVVKLSCSDTSINNIYGLVYSVIAVIIPLMSIVYSYIKILKVCFLGSKQTRQKAMSTCSPHIASLLNFSFGCFFQVLQSRFDMTNMPNILSIILSVYFLTCQPLFTPIMYGLKMTKIHELCRRVLCGVV